MFSRHNYRYRNLRHAYVEIDIICNSGISTIVFSDQSMPGFKMHDYSERPLGPRRKIVNSVTSENTIKLNYYGGRFDFDGLFHSPNKRRSCLAYWFEYISKVKDRCRRPNATCVGLELKTLWTGFLWKISNSKMRAAARCQPLLRRCETSVT